MPKTIEKWAVSVTSKTSGIEYIAALTGNVMAIFTDKGDATRQVKAIRKIMPDHRVRVIKVQVTF